jgi:hypothetical protein
VRNEERKGVFIAERLYQLFRKVADVCQTLAYVRYHYTTIQRVSRTFRYYLAINPKSSIRSILLRVHLHTIHKVRRTICQRMSGGPPTYVHTKRQERMSVNPSVHPVQKSNFFKMLLWLILVIQSLN